MNNQSSINRSSTPDFDDHNCNQEYSTPIKAKVQAVVEFNDAHKILYFKEDVFRHFGVERTSGYAMLRGESSRRFHHNSVWPELRGRKKAIDWETLKRLEEIIENGGIQARAMSWYQLAKEVGLVGSNRVHWHTIRNTMQDLEYHKCIACTRTWIAPHLRALRRTFARDKITTWTLEDWKLVRFSDEVHFGLSPQRRLRIIRRPGQRYCFDCMQEGKEPEERVQKRFHCWAWVGWNYKSDLIFYEVPGNTNGKMSQRVYIDSILEPIVKPCLEMSERFVLEEDGDSGHGSANNNNIVRKWKEENGLKYYFNAPKSPDLSIIENCWQPVKQWLSKSDHWDDETTLDAIRTGWRDHVPQEWINSLVEQMPQRMHDVLDGEGKMTGH